MPQNTFPENLSPPSGRLPAVLSRKQTRAEMNTHPAIGTRPTLRACSFSKQQGIRHRREPFIWNSN